MQNKRYTVFACSNTTVISEDEKHYWSNRSVQHKIDYVFNDFSLNVILKYCYDVNTNVAFGIEFYYFHLIVLLWTPQHV